MPPDRRIIILAALAFVAALAFPFFLKVARGGGGKTVPLGDDGRPKLVMPVGEKACVEPARYMRAKHMDLLNTWRDGFVRAPADGRYWLSKTDGRSHKMSLTGTCLKCHEKETFCDRCHTFMGESPYCFTCHHESPTAKSPTASR